MKLPNECAFSEISLAQSRNTDIPPDCCRTRASAYTIAADGPPLCRDRQTELEVYRCIRSSSFNGDALVHVASDGDSVKLRSCLTRSRLRLKEPSPSLVLALEDWQKLQCALKTSDFWALDTDDDHFGFDGAWWLIEGRRGDVYHSVSCWSPRGAARDLGCLFFALAKSLRPTSKLY
jgi:hypothetical protein